MQKWLPKCSCKRSWSQYWWFSENISSGQIYKLTVKHYGQETGKKNQKDSAAA